MRSKEFWAFAVASTFYGYTLLYQFFAFPIIIGISNEQFSIPFREYLYLVSCSIYFLISQFWIAVNLVRYGLTRSLSETFLILINILTFKSVFSIITWRLPAYT